MNEPWMQLCPWCRNRSPERNWCHVCNGAGVTNPPLKDVKINAEASERRFIASSAGPDCCREGSE
jgi:hypothetical protein